MIAVLVLAENSRTTIDVWDGALSRCKINDWFFHNSQSTPNFKAVLLIPYDLVARIHSIAIKKKNSKIFTFDRIWCVVFGLGSFGDYPLVSTSKPCTHDSSPVMSSLSKYGSLLNFVNISWAMSRQHWFCSKFGNLGTIFAAIRSVFKTSVKIAWHDSNDMQTSSATSLIVVGWLFKIIYFTALMFSSVVDLLEWAGRASSVTSSWPSSSRLYHNRTYVLLRLTKRHSQYLKRSCTFDFIFCTKLNTVSLVHFYE